PYPTRFRPRVMAPRWRSEVRRARDPARARAAFGLYSSALMNPLREPTHWTDRLDSLARPNAREPGRSTNQCVYEFAFVLPKRSSRDWHSGLVAATMIQARRNSAFPSSARCGLVRLEAQ